MDTQHVTYEPPMMVEAGDFNALTHGSGCDCRDGITREQNDDAVIR